jgi:transketolase
VLALTRQNVPQLRLGHDQHNRCAQGAYEIVPANGQAFVSIFATGSEVAIAVAARKFLAERGAAARVVSVPSFELFRAAAEERAAVIGNAPVRVGVEAAVRQAGTIIGTDGAFVGMTGFGASAPTRTFTEFGITPKRSPRRH